MIQKPSEMLTQLFIQVLYHYDNPEILSAINKSIPVIRRAEMLGELINLKQQVLQ